MGGGSDNEETPRQRMGLKQRGDWLKDLSQFDIDTYQSLSAMFAETRDFDVIWVLSVDDLGVLVFRSWIDDDGVSRHGLSTFTWGEIRSGRVHVE
jgi:hypothetical protein